jgi:hypothetical protein
VVVGSLGASVAFRKSLPRRFTLWLLVFWVLVGVVGSVAGVYAYVNVLPPRYQSELGTTLPFLTSFLPRRDADAIIPTAPAVDPNAALSLLDMPLAAATDEATAEPTPQPTEEANEATEAAVSMASTPIPTVAPTATTPPTLMPTPTTAPMSTAEAPAAALADSASLSVAMSEAGPLNPQTARLYGFTHIRQGWNNCGPANITMALSFYGWTQGQDYAASFLKPDKEDKNVSPTELVSFVNEQSQVRAITRIGGDMEMLKTFIANNFPVVIETGYMPEGEDWLGHYRTVVGYDDSAGVFYIYDSWLGAGENGAGIVEDYIEFDAHWRAFNRTFIVLYRPDEEARVAEILADRADPLGAAEHALAVAQEEARANRQDAFAWFNMGTALTKLGRYQEAAAAYDQARNVSHSPLPFRMLWYQFGPFEAYYEVGRYDDVLALVTSTLNSTQYVEEIFYWQGRALAARGDRGGAESALRQAIGRNPRFLPAQDALNALGA